MLAVLRTVPYIVLYTVVYTKMYSNVHSTVQSTVNLCISVTTGLSLRKISCVHKWVQNILCTHFNSDYSRLPYSTMHTDIKVADIILNAVEWMLSTSCLWQQSSPRSYKNAISRAGSVTSFFLRLSVITSSWSSSPSRRLRAATQCLATFWQRKWFILILQSASASSAINTQVFLALITDSWSRGYFYH